MPKLKDLQNEKTAVLDRRETRADKAALEKRGLTTEEVTQDDTDRDELRRIERQIEIAEARDEQDRSTEGRATGTDAERADAEFRAFAVKGETRAMNISTEAEGGHLVPEQIDRTIAKQSLETSPVRRVANVVSVSTSDYKKLVNRRGATSGWAGEDDTRTETATPVLAQIAPPMGELFAYPKVSNHIIDDAFIDIPAFLSENVTDEFVMQEGAAFVNGDGVNKPKGFMTGPMTDEADDARAFGTLQFVNSGSATTITDTDALIDLVTAVRPSYRMGASWMMNTATAAVLRKLKDADGRYLWTDSLTEGQPSRLLGYPVTEAEDMGDIEADGFPIAFGNFKRGYLIVDRVGLRVIRDQVTLPGWTKFYFAKRVGGALIDSNAIKLMKVAA